VRVRHRHPPAPAEIRAVEDGFECAFDAPQRAVAPGQAAVVYRGEEVVGGGVIV
jgi:tRNA-specific 2-thiouridylase